VGAFWRVAGGGGRQRGQAQNEPAATARAFGGRPSGSGVEA
jgi:hypothetical protein